MQGEGQSPRRERRRGAERSASEFRGGPPVEFGGRDDWWSPEHLLLSAAGLCLKTTFEVFTSISIAVELVVAEADVMRAADLVRTAKDHCIVANALKTPVRLAASVKATVPATA